MGEACNQYLSKGRQVFVEGRLIAGEGDGPRIWTNQEGDARASFEINAGEVKFLSGGRSDNGNDNAPAQDAGPDIDEGEIPF